MIEDVKWCFSSSAAQPVTPAWATSENMGIRSGLDDGRGTTAFKDKPNPLVPGHMLVAC
jgi:hypothetical protein